MRLKNKELQEQQKCKKDFKPFSVFGCSALIISLTIDTIYVLTDDTWESEEDPVFIPIPLGFLQYIIAKIT